MDKHPIIMALANPDPEITPDDAKKANPNTIMATGRSDYPNQVNNVICFPFIFRGALDVGATTINEEMKMAAAKAIAKLAKAETVDAVKSAYGLTSLTFGPECLIPKPFDPRLLYTVAPDVAKAAINSGVASRPIQDFNHYTDKLKQYVYRSTSLMQPVITQAKTDPKRIVYAEGEDERILHAVQSIVDDGIAQPILIGREGVIQHRIEKCGLKLNAGRDFELVNPEDDPRYFEYWSSYLDLMSRKGVSPDLAKTIMRTDNTAIASIMVKREEADTLIAGVVGQYQVHLRTVIDVIGLKEHVKKPAAMNGLVLPKGIVFICDTHVNPDPTFEDIAEMTILASHELKMFGIMPKVALLSHSNFGTRNNPHAVKMRKAKVLINEMDPHLEVDGEMHSDVAFKKDIREKMYPHCELKNNANLLIMPNLDSANISYNLLKVHSDGLNIGPILLGMKRPVNILSTSAATRTVVNMSALGVVDAQFNLKN